MVFKTITITQGGDPEWHEREGPDPFKPRCHYVMLVVFIIGILAIIAIGVWIGIDLKKSKKDKPTTTVTPVTDRPPTTTTASQTTTRSTTTRATTTAPPTTTNPVTTNRIVRSTVSSGV